MNMTEGREASEGIRIIAMIVSVIAGAFMLINSLIVLYMPMYTGMPMRMPMGMGMGMWMWMGTGMIAASYSLNYSVVTVGVVSSVAVIASAVLLSRVTDARVLGAIILASSLVSLFIVGSIIGSLLGIIGGSLALIVTARRV
jgi:hypothetical protein